jgi:hypothetical protein
MACDEFLADHRADGSTCNDEQHRAALRRRAGGAPSWHPIQRGRDGGGIRDFLEGRPITCGSSIELQALEYRDDNYGTYQLNLPTGVVVRYEVDGPLGAGGQVVLYGDIAGHDFTAKLHDGMRFRWPRRGGD